MAGLEFPQIFRKIPASRLNRGLWRGFLLLLIASILLFQLGKFGKNLYERYQIAKTKQVEKQSLEAQVAKWQEVIAKRADFRDAYFELAILTYRLNRLAEAKYYLAKTLALDPNFQPAIELEKELKNK